MKQHDGACPYLIIAVWVMQAAVDAFETGTDGQMQQVKGDDEYKHAVPLGRAYTICVARARKKAAKRRASSLRDLPLLGGHALEFTKEGRRALHNDILDRIRCNVSTSCIVYVCL